MPAQKKKIKKNIFDIHWQKRLKNYPQSPEFKKNLLLLKKEIDQRLPQQKPIPKIIFLFMGIPGAGKSTLAKIISRLYPSVILSSDWIFFQKLKKQIKDDYYKAYVYMERLMEIYTQDGHSIIIDGNNRIASIRRKTYKWAKKHNAYPVLIKIKAMPEDTVGRVTLKGGERQTRKEKLKGLRAFQSQMEQPSLQEEKEVKIININGLQPIAKIKKQLAVEISQF